MTEPRLVELSTFAKVVDAGSFTAAAVALNLPKSTVSRRITALEDHLGARLLERTTRSLSLTDIGREVYRHAARALNEAEEAERLVGRLQEAPRGLLRVTTTVTFGRFVITPILPKLRRLYPDLRIALDLSARPVDVIREGFDIAIRTSTSSADLDPAIITRKLFEASSVLCASPGYLAENGIPASPADLADHAALVAGDQGGPITWRMTWNDQPFPLTVTPLLTVNDPEIMVDACRDGLGVAWLPVGFVEDDLNNGTLVQILPALSIGGLTIDALYPRHAATSPKLRLFIEHLEEQISTLTAPK